MTEEQEAERLADSYDLDLKAEGLREAADAWEQSRPNPYPGLDFPSGVAEWLRKRAAGVEAEAERLRDGVRLPDCGGPCQVVEVDGEPVRVQGGAEMTAEDRAMFAEVVRATKRRMAAEGTSGD